MLQEAHRGDRKAQYALYRQCFPILMAVCTRYRRDEEEAASALNQGFLKIVNNLDRYTSEVPFEAWIRRIMINTIIDEFRRNARWREMNVFSEAIERDYPGATGGVSWNEGDQRLSAQYLEGLLRRLPPITQKVFNLFALDGFSHREISEMLSMSEGTSKWHVNHARQQLQGWIRVMSEK